MREEDYLVRSALFCCNVDLWLHRSAPKLHISHLFIFKIQFATLGVSSAPFRLQEYINVLISHSRILFLCIMISSCIHSGKGGWAMTKSPFQSSKTTLRPWRHVQRRVRRWEWDKFSYAQVQLVGTTCIQTMLHNTLWASANVITIPKFQNDQSVEENDARLST